MHLNFPEGSSVTISVVSMHHPPSARLLTLPGWQSSIWSTQFVPGRRPSVWAPFSAFLEKTEIVPLINSPDEGVNDTGKKN